MNLYNKIGYKLHCLVNYLWRKTNLKIFEKLNDYFAKWWLDDYLKERGYK
jgi:hypothetical protein